MKKKRKFIKEFKKKKSKRYDIIALCKCNHDLSLISEANS